MISVSILLNGEKAVIRDKDDDFWVEIFSNSGTADLFAGTSARARAIAAAINGELDAQFETVKYNFNHMEVLLEDIKRIKDFLAGSAGREVIGQSFLWEYTPEGVGFWGNERYSNAPLSDKARASLEAMVAQWDAEQATTS